MVKLFRLDSADPRTGGLLAEFPSGKRLQVAWRAARGPIAPTEQAAKDYAAKVLARLLDEGLSDDAERTNWPSFTAAVGRILRDFNERLPHAEVSEH